MYAVLTFTAILTRVHSYIYSQPNSKWANISDAPNGMSTIVLSLFLARLHSPHFLSRIFAQCRINLTLYTAVLSSIATIFNPAAIAVPAADSEGKNHFIYYVWFSTGLDFGIAAFPSKQIPRKIDSNSISKCVFRFRSATFSHYVVHFKDKFQYAVNWATTAIHLLY